MSWRAAPGVVLPQQEIGFDAAALRGWARELEQLGCAEIEAFDHVLGADESRWPEGPPAGHERIPYTHRDAFHEPLMLFSHLAAATTTIGFATTVLVLPQRQTALVAKQAAELDRLSGGRFRLGVGLGWNHAEYEALGEDFATRGRRLDEQVEMLRELFAAPLVERVGEWHRFDRVGINPLPGPIPIWIGGASKRAIERAARLGDGWALNVPATDPGVEGALARLEEALGAAGRSRAELEVSGWIALPGRPPEAWREDHERWRELGIDRVSLVTRGAGEGPAAHLRLVEDFLSAVPGSEQKGRERKVNTDDIVAIQQLIADYGHAVDSGDLGRLADVFSEGAVFQSNASDLRFEGLEAIRGWFALGKPPHPYSHQTTNVFVYGLDGDRARVRSKFIGIDPESGMPWTGDYDDRVVRTAAGWRIAERTSSNRHGSYDFQAAAARAAEERP